MCELLGVPLRIGEAESARKPVLEVPAPDATQDDRDAWRAYLALAHEDRRLARELIHALARGGGNGRIRGKPKAG